MKNEKNTADAVADANASSSSTKNQVATIKGFNFTKSFVRLYFSDKNACILGDKTADNIRLALELKGLSIEYRVVGTVTTEYGSYNKVAIECIC